jgi:hypothetical protein
MPEYMPGRNPAENPKVNTPNPGSEVEEGGGISRRSFLKSAVIGLGTAVLNSVLAECGANKEYEAAIDEFLKNAVYLNNIDEIKIYGYHLNGSSKFGTILENAPFWEALINMLKPMVSTLPKKWLKE